MQEPIRLNKYLSEAGVCSRREADRLAEEGKITGDGRRAAVGMKILPSQKILVEGKPVKREEEKVLLAVHKPRGIECTSQEKVKNNIVRFVNYHTRIYPVGRLDKDSEGLILMTNQGELVNKMMRAGNYHEKEYLVRVNKPITDTFLQKMAEGVFLKELNVQTRPCQVEKEGKFVFRIVLTQGLNRQIRRMCRALGFDAQGIKRVRVANITIGKLKPGNYRLLTAEELDELYGKLNS